MADLLGLVAMLVTGLFVYILAKRMPVLSRILIVAFVSRISLSLWNYYIGGLPESGIDAVNFEKHAWMWAQDELLTVLSRYPDYVNHGYLISWIVSILYHLTDRSLLMAQTISVLFGVGSIYLGFKVSAEIWSRDIALKSAWVMVLFPSWILYSVLMLREVYIYLFLLIALLGVVRWIKFKKIYDLLMAICGFIGATLFHGAMVIGFFAFLLFVLYRSYIDLIVMLKKTRASYMPFLIIISGCFLLYMYFQSLINIPYLGVFSGIDVDKVMYRTAITVHGVSAYPLWLVPDGFFDMLWKMPFRIIYFFFSPMPWDVTSLIHLIGIVDGFLYLVLLRLIWINWNVILSNPPAKILFFILVSYVLVFSLGTGNSGTALRHRAKLFPIIVVLAAPLIPTVRIRSKKRRKKSVSSLMGTSKNSPRSLN